LHNAYTDITSRIQQPPLWWDEQAVPRYCDFSPGETANIYAQKACLFLIECQGCGHPFKVCISQGSYTDWDLADLVRNGTLHYGDPPNYNDCCAAGATMNSCPRQVLEFWERTEKVWDWVRVPELEIPIHADWDVDEP
jgi:hypothetical protein